jgi:hypothetical protein
MQYTAIEASNVPMLLDEVKTSIRIGWEPLGAPVYGPSSEEGEMAWIQFMTRHDKN